MTNCTPPTPNGPGWRVCLEMGRGPAAGDFGGGQGGEVGASPQRAAMTEPTPDAAKRPAARRVFAETVVWLRCSSVPDPQGVCSLVTPRQPAISPKTEPLPIFRQTLTTGCSRTRQKKSNADWTSPCVTESQPPADPQICVYPCPSVVNPFRLSCGSPCFVVQPLSEFASIRVY